MRTNFRKDHVKFKSAKDPKPKHYFCFGTVDYDTSGKKLRVTQKVLFDFLVAAINNLEQSIPHQWKIFKDILRYRNTNPLWAGRKMVVHYVKEEGSIHFFLKTGNPE